MIRRLIGSDILFPGSISQALFSDLDRNNRRVHAAGQQCAVVLPIALGMISAVRIYFLIFGVLTIVGGIIGYVNKGSVASVVAGSISGILLLIAALLFPANFLAGLIIAALVSLLLAGQFLPKLVRTGQMMPAGIMSVLSILGIIAVIAAWAGK